MESILSTFFKKYPAILLNKILSDFDIITFEHYYKFYDCYEKIGLLTEYNNYFSKIFNARKTELFLFSKSELLFYKAFFQNNYKCYDHPYALYLLEIDAMLNTLEDDKSSKNIELRYAINKPSSYGNEGYTPNGYFSVFISSSSLFAFSEESTLEKLREDLIATSGYQVNKQSVLIPCEQINLFLENFSSFMNDNTEESHIYPYHFCLNKNIDWSRSLLKKYNHIWNWNALHKNRAVKWDFEIIDENKDFLNWAYISNYPFLKWDSEKLDHFKDYLIFSLSHRCPFSGKNKLGKRYEIDYEFQKENLEFKGSISLAEHINWSPEIIETLKNHLDFKELSSNESVIWDEYLIDKFIEKVNFPNLSSNKSIPWTEELILKYFDKWDWQNLSGNPKLPWSYDFMLKFSEKWYWDRTIYVRSHFYRDQNKEYLKPCISSNTGIEWDVTTLEKWNDKINFWTLAMVGQINIELIKIYQSKFFQKEIVYVQYTKNSDWGPDITEYYRTAWENLALNKNFKIQIDDMLFFKDIRIENTSMAQLLEILSNVELIGLNWGEIMNNKNIEYFILHYSHEYKYYTWRNDFHYYYTKQKTPFINDTLWNNFIVPDLTKQFIINYLDEFKLANCLL